jgi:hypothetical protein
MKSMLYSIYSLLMCYIFFMLCPLRASKTFTLFFKVQVNHLGAASQGGVSDEGG